MDYMFAPTLVDFYKTGHIRQYPRGTEYVYSNFTCRSDRLARVLPDFDHRAVFFGLQGALQMLATLWDETFFDRPHAEVINRYSRRMDGSLGPGAVSADHMSDLHDLGYLPLVVKALPEGSRVPMRVPMFTIANTLPEFYWLTNYVETQLSAEVWKAVHSATIAHEFRRLLDLYARETGTPAEFVPWQGHDFSARGMSGNHDAAVSGAAHLLSFTGTDTVHAIDYLEEYYSAAGTFVGGSVPATEHSVMCMGGAADELGTIRRLATETYPSGVVSIVSDTWDFWRVLTEYAPALREQILAREPNALGLAKVVFRPDSGDPVRVICGDLDAPNGSPAHAGAVQLLWDAFGGTTTSTGHRLVHERVGLIYGDNITLERAQAILEGLEARGFASGNIVFGVGSFTYNYATRDSLGAAIKATFGVVNSEDRVLFKDPVTDSGTKKSARGLLRVDLDAFGDYILRENVTREEEAGGELRTVFSNGWFSGHQSLAGIRARLVGTR